MGKKLFITGAILLLLAGFIFLGALFASFQFSRMAPVQVFRPLDLYPVQQEILPQSENLTAFSADLDDALNQIQEQVISIRHLVPDETIYRNTLTQAELSEKVKTDFFADYSDEDLRRDTITYSLLGVIEPDFDLYDFVIDLYSEQIAGYYDDEAKEMVVVQGGDFGGPERMTYAHEFTHLLQDQTYDFQLGLNFSDELLDTDMDAYLALQSLVEGDAVMTEYLWYQMYASEEDQLDVQQFSLEMNTPVYDTSPVFIKNELLYPYQFGLEFVHTIYVEKGWPGVAALYANPPRSTEQIMHPERYPDDVPLTVSIDPLEAALPAGWEKISDSTFGESYLYLLLMNGQDEITADVPGIWQAVKGWGGDHYQLYVNEPSGEVLFVLKTIWDTETDADEFSAEFLSYAENRWPEGQLQASQGYRAIDPNYQQVRFYQNGVETYWIFAPDEAMTNSVINALNLGVE